MKTLQNNYTTPEQSKRLLELGVPADSADCYYDIYNGRINVIHTTDASWRETDKAFMYYQSYLPCWSAGRLIEIFEICTGQVWQNEIIENYSKIDMLLEDFEDREQKYTFDFSKLEE